MVNAAKERIGAADALALVARHSKLVSAKGKKIVTVNLKRDDYSDDDIVRLVMGPSGNLRAPTWTRGRTIVVGFNEEAYDSVLG